jgi:hypothetical protein
MAEAAINRSVPDHDLTVLGLSNVNRAFVIADPTNGPAAIFRRVYPFIGMTYGWSSTGITDQDPGAATDTALAADAVLYPITWYAKYVESDLWPVLENLFSSGTGQRYSVTLAEFVRYNAMIYRAHSTLMTVMQVNHLAFHFDWKQVTPFTSNVPNYMYDMATSLDATDVGLASRWLPLIRRFETKIMFPRIIDDVKRMYSPMMSIDLNGRLLVPVYDMPLNGQDADSIEATVTDLLNYIEVELARASALFQSFLPFPSGPSRPFDLNPTPSIDIDRESGWSNSGIRNFPAFGDTGDPVPLLANQFEIAGTATPNPDYTNLLYFTRHTQATWAELRLATVWELIVNTVDNDFRLMSPHQYAEAYIVDDEGTIFEYNGQYIDYTSNGWRYAQYIGSRYTFGGIPQGMQIPGFVGAEIGHDPYRRMVRQQVQYDWNLEVLKLISQQMAGASIRELRLAIQQAVVAGVSSPY